MLSVVLLKILWERERNYYKKKEELLPLFLSIIKSGFFSNNITYFTILDFAF